MNKNSKIALVALIAIGIGVSAFYWLRVGEPVYQGKTANQWFAEIEYNGGIAHNDQGVQALVAMGGDVVPYLMKQLSFQDSRLRKFFSTAVRKVSWIKLRPMSESERHLRAFVPLMLMGTNAAQAVPELLRLTEKTNLLNRHDVFQLLGYVHSQPEVAVPVLMRFLEWEEGMTKLGAISALGKYGESAAAAAPKLREFLKSDDKTIRIWAAIALVGIGDSIDLAVPIIRDVLNDPTSSNRYGLLFSLGELGEKAKPIVPLLIDAAKDEKSPNRSELIHALKRIDPKAAVKAGVN